MNYKLITQLLDSPDEKNITRLLDDRDTVFWVDWREEDDAIIEYCENILKTGQLGSDLVDADNEAGCELFIQYGQRRWPVPLLFSPKDRHITLLALNQALAPDYEVRLCVDSQGGDTLAFLPLSQTQWQELESNYGEARVAKHFYRLQTTPNVFTDSTP